MTIAFAVRAEDGIAIAADSQETYDDGTKVSQPKIVVVPQDGTLNMYAIAGTGDADFIEVLTDELIKVHSQSHADGVDALRNEFGECVRRFHVEHVAPYGEAFFDGHPADMLIAVQRNGAPAIFVTALGTIRTATRSRHHAIGAGSAFASTLLGRLSGGHAPQTRDVELLAAYVAFRVKESAMRADRSASQSSSHATSRSASW